MLLRNATRVVIAICLFALAGCEQRTTVEQAIQRRTPKPPFLAWVALTGSSMLPKYATTGYVELDMNYPFEKLAVGDEICFWDYNRAGGDKFTFHRIIGQNDQGFVTQGLNAATNPNPDTTLVNQSNYQGRATGRYSVILLPPKPDAP